MIGLDTNVIVRYLTKDDPAQTTAAVRIVRSLTESEPGFVSLVVIAELVWVLETSYRFTKQEVIEVLETLTSSKELILESPEAVSQAIRLFRAGRADFSDYLIERTGRIAGCVYTITFDRNAARSANMRLLK